MFTLKYHRGNTTSNGEGGGVSKISTQQKKILPPNCPPSPFKMSPWPCCGHNQAMLLPPWPCSLQPAPYPSTWRSGSSGRQLVLRQGLKSGVELPPGHVDKERERVFGGEGEEPANRLTTNSACLAVSKQGHSTALGPLYWCVRNLPVRLDGRPSFNVNMVSLGLSS